MPKSWYSERRQFLPAYKFYICLSRYITFLILNIHKTEVIQNPWCIFLLQPICISIRNNDNLQEKTSPKTII